MPKNIIADTSCLVLLEKIDEFDILQKLYETVLITPVIANEFGNELPKWIEVRKTDESLGGEELILSTSKPLNLPTMELKELLMQQSINHRVSQRNAQSLTVSTNKLRGTLRTYTV